MAEVRIGDYVGYWLIEMSRARELGDQYSERVAERYAAEVTRKDFSVPRFRIPKLQLTLPVVVSRLQLNDVTRFMMSSDNFERVISEQARSAVQLLADEGIQVLARGENPSIGSVDETRRFYNQLMAADPDAEDFDAMVAKWWSSILRRLAARAGPLQPGGARSLARVEETTQESLRAEIHEGIGVDRGSFEGIMVHPETSVVANETNDATIVTLKVEIVEEGFFIRSYQDESGATRSFVELE